MADFIVGSPARDDDFWFRDAFVDDLWEALKKHNLLMVAPRRIGKTSVMYRMLEQPKDGWLVIHLNVEDLKNPGDFFVTIVDAIYEHQPNFLKEALASTWDFLKNMFSHIDTIEAFEVKLELRKIEDIDENWRARMDQLIDKVIASNKKILFIIDELPDLLNAIAARSTDEFAAFLHWFRKTRDKSLKSNLRWLTGGSINLLTTLDQQGKVNLINDLKVETLLPFNSNEVAIFVERMLSDHQVRFDKSVAPRVIELLGSPIPMFLQLLTQELYRKWKRNRDETVTAETVIEVFNKALLGETARDKLQHYRSRIEAYYPDEDKDAACGLLTRLSLSDKGIGLKNVVLSL